MIRSLFSIAAITFLHLSQQSLHAESFSDYRQSQQPDTKTEFQQYKSTQDAEFEAYKKQLQDAFKHYKTSVATIWGKKDAVIPDNKTDVSYHNDLNQRSIIDYEKGTITVDITVTPKEADNAALINKKMQQALSVALNRGTDPRSIIDIAKNPSQTKTKGAPILQDLVSNPQGKVLTKTEQTNFIQQQSQKIKSKNIRGTDNKPRVMVSTQLVMIPDHLRVQAEKYKKPVKLYADNMRIPAELVYAIIETESAFNPNARSSVPAFGLMQLVPTSGARDAYRLLFNEDKVVSDRYLYNPENNIKLGAAFIHKLYYDYLPGITNLEARTWATIAAYNTGAGNVFTSFAGKYRRSKFGNRSDWKNKALSIINSMSAEQVYQHLKQKLPYKETQHYIQNIRKRIPQYKTI